MRVFGSECVVARPQNIFRQEAIIGELPQTAGNQAENNLSFSACCGLIYLPEQIGPVPSNPGISFTAFLNTITDYSEQLVSFISPVIGAQGKTQL